VCVSGLCRCLRLFVVRSQWLLECCAGAGGGWARHGVGSQDKAAVLAFPDDPDEEMEKHGAASNGFRIQRPIAQSSLVSVCSFQDRDSGDVAFAILIAVVVNHS